MDGRKTFFFTTCKLLQVSQFVSSIRPVFPKSRGFQRGAPFGRCKERLGVWGKEKLRIEKVWFSFPQIVYQLFKADSSQSLG